MTDIAPKKVFTLGFSGGWNCPDGADPSSDPRASRLFADFNAEAMDIDFDLAQELVGNHKDMAPHPDHRIGWSYSTPMQEVHGDILNSGVVEQTGLGDFGFYSFLKEDLGFPETRFVFDCEGGVKALANAWERIMEMPDGRFEMAFVLDSGSDMDDLPELVDQIVDNQDPDLHDGAVFIYNGKTVIPADGRPDPKGIAVTVSGKSYKVDKGICSALDKAPDLAHEA